MTDYTIDNKCAEGCGKCCTRALPYSDYEVKKIKQYVRRNNISPTHTNPDICPFLNDNKRCQVYIHRGEICREFICNTHMKEFNHRDKHIIDMWAEFFPECNIPSIDTNTLDMVYQSKKKEVYGR